MHNGKYHTEQYKKLQAEKYDRNFGPIEDHTKVCQCCGSEFVFTGRKKTKAFERAKFCSRSCSNNRQQWWNGKATHYRTIAFQTWEKKCVICGFDKIVDVHHLNEDHSDNRPENLIPLCPNHHEMYHSKYKDEVIQMLNEVLGEVS